MALWADLGSLGGALGASWGSCGDPWEVLEVSWIGVLGGFLGRILGTIVPAMRPGDRPIDSIESATQPSILLSTAWRNA